MIYYFLMDPQNLMIAAIKRNEILYLNHFFVVKMAINYTAL